MGAQIEINETELRRLYEQEGLSQREIAKKLGCSKTTVADRMREYGIHPRPPHVPSRFDISEDDLRRLYQGEKLSQEQIAAIYGCSMIAFLNPSFSFLLDLQDMIPDWVLADPEAFRAFLAGYTDAEGSIWISNGYAAFALCSYDKNILHQIHGALLKLGVECPPPRIHYPKGYTNKYGIRYSKDYWELKIGAKRALLRLFDLLEPYLKHAKRRQDMVKARANIEERNRRFGNRGM